MRASRAEVKPDWAFKACKKQSCDQLLAFKLGQLASIYTTTWLLKRVDDYHFVVSDGISSQNARSFPDDPVTMRECLLFLLKKAADHEASYYPRVYGIDLRSNRRR
ncbi:uncharacterized protein ASPGLDRAFT_26860 [Aspergillus glaucus CBS 516.65]|uniref:Uncharacterized protein n=1 Tax=Aspergillus glaucus CBS 516.65 TaxID=1160497 RepID=A0A1L9VFC1_ASPGL|nr:hypothetical protein ASPGLDRAFT_26860 [Aspergillus glaucus CBS 516.65]OJJ82593.1 hypothetical protein ASPGLDRAFT_26860 [Aspergillus glaucus CBS 516.65]